MERELLKGRWDVLPCALWGYLLSCRWGMDGLSVDPGSQELTCPSSEIL